MKSTRCLFGLSLVSFAATGVEYFNTFGGNPVSCAIALAVIDVVKKEKLQENAALTGIHLLEVGDKNFSSVTGSCCTEFANVVIWSYRKPGVSNFTQLAFSIAFVLQRLRVLAKKYPAIGDVRGHGLMVGIDLTIDPATREPATELAKKVILWYDFRAISMSTTNLLEWICV